MNLTKRRFGKYEEKDFGCGLGKLLVLCEVEVFEVNNAPVKCCFWENPAG